MLVLLQTGLLGSSSSKFRADVVLNRVGAHAFPTGFVGGSESKLAASNQVSD